MSYDFKAIQSCDHTFHEFFPLNADNTLHVPWPYLNVNTCKVAYNGQPVPETAYYFRNVQVNGLDFTYVYFKEYRRTADARYRLRLTVSRDQCPKCNRTGVSVDVRVKRGGVIDVLDTNRDEHLYQQFMLYIRTREGSDPFYPRYGSRLHQMIGKGTGVLNVSSEIQRVYQQWLSVRRSYDQVNGNTQQKYFTISNTKVTADPADSRQAQVSVSLTNQNRRLIVPITV